MSSLAFKIPCTPPTATAQQKGVMVIGGKPRFFKKKRQQQAENTLWALLQPHAPKEPFSGPLSLVVTFEFPWRKTERKRVTEKFRTCPIAVRPDAENLFKGLGDVMTTLRFWHDDSQLASLCLHKLYSDEPGITVVLTSCLGTTREGTQAEVV